MRAKLFMFIAAAMLVSASASAQEINNQNPPEGATTSDCASGTFSSGGGATRLTYCVSSHGNVARLESPQGFEHVNIAFRHEGYVLCNGTTILAKDTMDGGEFGWGPAFILAGPSGSGVTIRRTTTNGFWQLDQKFSRDNKENDVTILMTLKNLGPFAGDVRLARVVDFDVDNTPGGDVHDRSDKGVWAREARGMTLTNITFGQAIDTAIVGVGADGCSLPSFATPTGVADNGHAVTARLGSMNPGKTLKTTFVYRRQ